MSNVEIPTDLWKRLEAISKCMLYIEECEKAQSPLKSFQENWNWIWGWLDWMEELHRLIHENI